MADMKKPRLASTAAARKTPRPHQELALARIRAALSGERRPSNPTGARIVRPAVDLAVAFGKTITFAHVIKENMLEGQRALVLVDRTPLVDQAVEALRDVLPDLEIGIVDGDHKEYWADVVVAMKQTLENPLHRAKIKNVAWVIADECHGTAADTWRAVLTHYNVDLSDDPAPDSTPLIGFTGTMMRMDDRALVGAGGIFQEVVHRKTILDGIKERWLVDPIIERVDPHVDYGELAAENGSGEAFDTAAADALIKAGSGNNIANMIFEKGRLPDGSLRQGIIMVSRVNLAEHVAETLNERGIPTAVVSGLTPKTQYVKIMQDLDAGKLTMLITVEKLGVGFDKKYLSMGIMLRPTKSQRVFIQFLGRILRLSPATGKKDALFLDATGVAEDMGLVGVNDIFGDVRDGETVGEAAERREADVPDDLEIEPFPEETVRDVELIYTPIDPFADTSSVILSTYDRGMKFVPTTNAYFYMWPRKNGRYNVRTVPTWIGNGKKPVDRRRDSTTLEFDVEFDDGLEWMIKAAEAADPTVARRDRKWRRGQPSAEQVRSLTRMGAQLGVDYTTRGQASDLLSQHGASKILDR